jgi:S1-C subfamily serine protease
MHALLFALLALQDPGDRLQKKVEECSRYISERFVYFGGGSGVFISEEGHALTNHHVAGTVKETKVTLFTGKLRKARLICTDAVGDIALFKVEAEGDEKFPFVEFGDSDRLEPAQYALACGNPFGITMPAEDLRYYPTITLGIVSAIHRNQGTYFDCIQTDAAVNPGNSGGPLVTLDGKLVGINGRIATRYFNRVNSGVGYAIPSNQIRNFLPEMMKGGENGKISHGQVTGLRMSAVHTDGQGARVALVEAGSPAQEAGFKPDDLVVRVNDYAVFNKDRFEGAIGTYPKGSTVSVRVKRGGEEKDLRVRLQEFRPPDLFGDMPRAQKRGGGYLGATTEDKDGGIKVTYVRPGFPADEAGLREGDVVLKLDDHKLANQADLVARLLPRRPGDKVKLVVRRDGDEVELEVRLGRYPQD